MAELNTRSALVNVLNELMDGPSPEWALVLNPGDIGLLQSLDALSAEQASMMPAGGGSSIAAHVDHLRYGLELLNRWSDGEDPFKDADYSASWTRNTVSEEEWGSRREALRQQVNHWRESLQRPRDLTPFELSAVVGSVVHLAYHLGAVRQINRAMAGPSARD